MADLFEYIRWRGDLRFGQVGPTDVDIHILSTLVYIKFNHIIPETAEEKVSLGMVWDIFQADPDRDTRLRVSNDSLLLKAAAQCPRFRDIRLHSYRDVFVPEENTQFAAFCCDLDDGTTVVVYRGTDKSLVGWKEDFEMAFRESVSAQRLALEYLTDYASYSAAPLVLCGHSKGGNLAIYAGACCDEKIRKRILRIVNLDGPGFHRKMLTDPGYLAIIPKVATVVPQGSIIGMLLKRGESYRVIRSNQIGLLQHEPYSWQVMGPDFVEEGELSADAQFWDRTFDNWIDETEPEQREALFGAVFDFLMTEGVTQARDLIKPQNILQYIKNLKNDENIKQLLRNELNNLVQSARGAQKDRTIEKTIDN